AALPLTARDLGVCRDAAPSGPGRTWAREAPSGSAAALLDEGRLSAPPSSSTCGLLVGDESALPAIAGILTQAPPTLRGLVVVEVGYRGDIRALTRPHGGWVACAARAE